MISIHTFLAEGDKDLIGKDFADGRFQSTPSSRKVTVNAMYTAANYDISIHTFLAEGDRLNALFKDDPNYISIHTFLAEGDCFSKINKTFFEHHFNPHLPRGR